MTTIKADRAPVFPAGGFEGHAFLFPIRVYYEDTDFSGVVYHANYLCFMERARSEFLRAMDLPHQAMLAAEEPLTWAVRRLSVEFNAPAKVEDALVVRTSVKALTVARMKLAQSIWRGETLLIEAEVEVCLITLQGRPRRFPEAVAERLKAFL